MRNANKINVPKSTIPQCPLDFLFVHEIDNIFAYAKRREYTMSRINILLSMLLHYTFPRFVTQRCRSVRTRGSRQAGGLPASSPLIFHNSKETQKVIPNPDADPDHQQKLITSCRSPLAPRPCLPSFVDVRFRVRQLSCLDLENDRRNNHITSAS